MRHSRTDDIERGSTPKKDTSSIATNDLISNEGDLPE